MLHFFNHAVRFYLDICHLLDLNFQKYSHFKKYKSLVKLLIIRLRLIDMYTEVMFQNCYIITEMLQMSMNICCMVVIVLV